MSCARTTAIVTASVATVAAANATLAHWTHGAAPALRGLTFAAWVTCVVIHYGEKILADIAALRAAVAAYGDERHSEGVIDGLQQRIPAPVSGLRGLN